MKKRSSDLFIRCLENEGVEYIFGLPGEENLDLLDSLSKSSIQFVSTRHEQGAAFMADVYGRLTGRAGVCLSTLGPGATNLATGIADANLDHAPLVAITAQAGLDRVHKESHQYVDIVECFRPLTKWNARIERASSIPEVIRKAFKISQTEKPGACHIEYPEDIAREVCEGKPLDPKTPRRGSPDQKSLLEAAELIDQSSRPIILAGNGVIRGRASDALLHFSKKTGIPVAHTFMGKGAVPSDYDLSLFTIGLQAHDYVSFGFDQADLIIAAGYDLVEYSPSRWNVDRNKKIIHVDFLPAEVDEFYQTAVEIIGDIQETLKRLSETVQVVHDTSTAKVLRNKILETAGRGIRDSRFPMNPDRVIHELREVMNPEDILISDVGIHKLWIARHFQAHQPNTVIISNGFAAMGIALPGAIAAKLIHPDRRVVSVSGDGGFLLNAQELETLVRLKLSVVNIVFRDNGYGLIQFKQEKTYGRSFGVSFGNPDFVKLAESFGVKGYQVDTANSFKKILNEALRLKGPSLIELPVDYRDTFQQLMEMGNFICPM
ncbi:MAG TPA: acetolactate synthase large subunit [Nitrospiria bacterium]|nr:acetolactate synthase large subunit [Nitrospiria bacterium]